uniref:Ribosomal protein S21 n=1 Tax=Hucho hucho TaxID=62062 RepID=A0A4W5K694_9TELE
MGQEHSCRPNQDNAGPIVSASNRIIGAKDHASIQINIAEVDKATGRFNGQFKTYAICGAIRRMSGFSAYHLLIPRVPLTRISGVPWEFGERLP